ncbi:phosphotransferase [Aeromicrobium sp. CnD17-E]|uniref:phosphotransferase family protein n=1 Tax=Aeromicrobium sp. CnD17-E TaxID=2954487 RepID=UPI0020980CA1|nr:phosphotransferase [Aeromicrobium sp. CnD17-E]MCO7240602.1 phosphotransferase family protein [Aeromicrobium sp. CnD17-E]
MSTPEGLDLDAFARWLDEQAPGLLVGPLEASLITGGKSNLTYAVTDGRRDVIVRRPPLGHVLATAHDMGREHRVIAALADTAVPVPVTHGLCQDDAVTGAPFYVMERVVGTPFARASDLAALGEQRVRTITARMVDVLADLHAVDPDDVGLGDFGRPDGYLERQVRRWKKQLDASRSRELPGMDELIARLDASIPTAGEGTIVHGDYRLDNLLVDASPDGGDRVTAVLDWEMSTLGDPLTDVAVLLAYQQLAEEAGAGAGAGLVTDAAQAPGYLSREEVLARYAQRSGRDVSDIDFHLALAFFKLAVILEGIHFRHSHGQTLGAGFDGIGDLIEPLVQAGLRA